MKRLGILFFYDKSGVVDAYVEYLLKGLSPYFSRLLTVVNGRLEPEQKAKLAAFGEVLERENKGFDVWAYKTGIEHVGWDAVAEFDELVMFNNTIMGPVDSFAPTFEKMQAQPDIDFWGITKYFEYRAGDPFGTIKYGYIPDHIQSHFIAVRQPMLTSAAFRDYWEKMPPITSYQEAIGFHEAIFTKTFADLGYKWTTSVDMEGLRDFSNHPILFAPRKMIEELGCPIFKKRSFFHDIADTMRNTAGEPASELVDYLREQTAFDTEMIWAPILRQYDQYDIVKNLSLEYTLSTRLANRPAVEAAYQGKRVALVIHLYFDDLIEEMHQWLTALPAFFDVYVTTVNEAMRAAVQESFASLPVNKLDIRIVENRGRDVGALLVGVKDVIMDYDVVCFAHDKKTAQIKPYSVGASFSYKCFENILANQTYVYNVLDTFERNPHLGLLTPPEPNHADFFPTLGAEWGPNLEVTKELAEKLRLHVSIQGAKPPVAPLGTMFWFRPAALKKLFAQDWHYTDFPPEPNSIDGTLLHAVERVYPFVAQDAGYYPAFVMSDRFTAVEFMNLHHYVRCMNQAIQSNHRYFDERVMDIVHAQRMAHLVKHTIHRLVGSRCYRLLGDLRRKLAH